jgi:hypothetical protein
MNTNKKTPVSEKDRPMDAHRQAATIVGVLFIFATVSAILGLSGATLVFGYAMLVLFGAAVQGAAPLVVLALPIAVYEMILAGWLIVKGFNSSAVAYTSVKTQTDEVLSAA